MRRTEFRVTSKRLWGPMAILRFKEFGATLALAASLTCTTLPAQSADIAVDIDITLGELLILTCYDDVTVNLTGAQLATAMGFATGVDAITASTTVAPTGALGALTHDFGLPNGDEATVTTSLTLNLNNMCGVRAIDNDGTVQLSVSAGTSFTLTNGTDSLPVTGVATSSATATGVSLGTLTPFGVTMGLDFSGVGTSGTYNLNAGEFTVTATNT